MRLLKIGLLREGKNPPDKRVVFTPQQAEEVVQRYPHVNLVCQSSDFRCYKDQEYRDAGIPVVGDVSGCDILMGVKEVPVQDLIAGKTYLFFSHTIKKQPHNRRLLQEILAKKIHLIDYETLKDFQGNRLVAFGRYAGIVGAYNALWSYGLRYKGYTLRRAFECFDVNDLKRELRHVDLPPVKIVLTGAGRVGKGAMETLDSAWIRKVRPDAFLRQTFDEPVYTQLGSSDYHRRKEGGHFNREEFHTHPEKYESTFSDFAKVADILVAGAFWNPRAPKLFTREDMIREDFRIRLIADITCDIDGSIPSTKRASTIIDPLYDYDPRTDKTFPPLLSRDFITVMGVDNLPCELPRSASEEFGRDLINYVLRPLLVEDTDQIIARATITKDGELTPYFEYLRDYINQTPEQTITVQQ
jgi:saccharopine dehydrogenase (NAD+, L-lysine forming)